MSYYFSFIVEPSQYAGGGFQRWAGDHGIQVADDGTFSGAGFAGQVIPEDDKIKIAFHSKPFGLQEEKFVNDIKRNMGDENVGSI